jgi:hypothetical protein
VQSPLENAHYNAIAPALEKTSAQALLAYAKVPVPEKRLHARQATLYVAAAERTAEAFLRNPREKTLLHLLLLPRVLGIGLQRGQLATILRAYPTTIPTLEEPEERSSPTNYTPIERATQLLEKGYVGRAARALLDPTPLAEPTPATLETLREKHPIGVPEPFRGAGNPRPGQPITTEAVAAAIASIGKEKAPGLSGWTRPLLDIVTAKPGNPVLAALRLLADMIRQGTAPGSHLLCASRLIALRKPDGGIRPIAIGDLLYRVALKAILTTSFKPGMLLPCQLGVNSPGGVEPAVFLLQDAISGSNTAKISQIAALDLSNAFNSVSRTSIATAVAKYAPAFYKATEWAYNKPSILVTDDGTVLASAEGVRQGDPLGPLLFSLAFRPTIEALQKALPRATIVAYLDDVYILGKDRDRILPRAEKVFFGSPFSLNRKKSSENAVESLKIHGLRTLGTYIGPLPARRTFLQGKIDALARALDALRNLPKQYAILLLRSSIHLLLRHLLRQLEPGGLLDLWKRVDGLIEDTIVALASRGPGRPAEDLQKVLIALPVRDGGLGLPLHAELADDLYKAARAASEDLILRIQPDVRARSQPPAPSAQKVLRNANSARLAALLPTLSLPQQRARLENASYLGRKWLQILPLQKPLVIADPETTEALRARLLAPCRPLDRPCTHCGALPTIGHEDTCRAASRRWISRHNQAVRAFTNALSCRTDLQVETEPRVEATEPTESTARRTDFSVLLGSSRYYYDVQIVAVNKDSARDDAHATLSEAAAEKRRKYSSLGPFFKPLIFSAGGLMEKDTAQAYKGLQKLLNPAAVRWLDSSLGLILTKTRAYSASSIAEDTPTRRAL